MKPFSGFEAKKSAAGRAHLPAGGYVVKILNAEEVENAWGRSLVLSFDVAEGEHAGFFQADYQDNPNENRKWRGNYRLRIPKDDGSKEDGWAKRTFGNVIWAFEESNPEYHWNWDENTLTGKTVGMLFRDKEWEMETAQGYRTGWTTEACAVCAAQDVRDQKFTMPKAKPLANSAVNAKAADFAPLTDADAADLPWKL